MLVALESLDREAESVPKIGGGVPRRLLYHPGETSASTAGRTRLEAALLSEGHFGTVHQLRGAVIVQHIRLPEQRTTPLRSVPFIEIDQ